MVVSLLDFLKTGRLGGIELGMSLEDVKKLFGEPVKWDGSFHVSLWFERDILRCLELHYGCDPDGDITLQPFHKASSNFEIDFDGINFYSNFEQILHIVHDCDLISAEESWPLDRRWDKFYFKSGVVLEFYEKGYPDITTRLGELTSNLVLLKT